MIESIKKLLLGKEKKDKRITVLFVIGIVGMLLILLSDFLPENKADSDTADAVADVDLDETEEYRRSIENELSEIISSIQGVTDVEVMITISSTKEYVYAEQTNVNQQTQSGSETLAQSGEIVLEDVDGDKQPVIKKIITPQISGAVVVCAGVENVQTKERVLNAVSAALGIPSNRISVEPKN